jgi:hypothetical protein
MTAENAHRSSVPRSVTATDGIHAARRYDNIQEKIAIRRIVEEWPSGK